LILEKKTFQIAALKLLLPGSYFRKKRQTNCIVGGYEFIVFFTTIYLIIAIVKPLFLFFTTTILREHLFGFHHQFGWHVKYILQINPLVCQKYASIFDGSQIVVGCGGDGGRIEFENGAIISGWG
jgi:hypothetical protein